MNNHNYSSKFNLIATWFLLSFCFTLNGFSQLATIDSLKNELVGEKTDSNKVKLFLQLANQFESINADSSIHFLNTGLALARKNNLKRQQLKLLSQLYSIYDKNSSFKKVTEVCDQKIQLCNELNDSSCLFKQHHLKATALLQSGDLDSAIIVFLTGIKIGEKIEAFELLAFTHNNLGIAYVHKGTFDLSLGHFIKSLEYRKLADMKIKPSILLNIGVVSLETGNKKIALEYFKEGLTISIANSNKKSEGLCLQNIGAVLTEMDSLQQAVHYLNRSNEINLELNDSTSICKYYIGMGDIDRKKNDVDQCIEHYMLAKKYFPAKGSGRQKMYIHLDLADAYYLKYKEGRFTDVQKIIDYAQVAYRLSDEIGFLRNKSQAAALLFKMYKKQGNYSKAVNYASDHILIQDSLFSQEKIDALNEVQTKYETEKKEAEIAFLDKENEIKAETLIQAEKLQQNQLIIILLLAFGFLIAAAAIFWIYKIYIEKKKANDALETKNSIISTQKEEKEILLKEIHHRVKNNLQVISSLLDTQLNGLENEFAKTIIEDSQSRVKAMALIHEKLYQNENLGKIDMHQYIKQLFTQLNAVYQKQSAQFQLTTNQIELEIDTAVPLGLILNELLSNCLKYANPEQETLKIEVEMKSEKQGHFVLLVKDNGSGLDESLDFNSTKTLGLRLVRRLAKQLYGEAAYKTEQGAVFSVRFLDINERKKIA